MFAHLLWSSSGGLQSSFVTYRLNITSLKMATKGGQNMLEVFDVCNKCTHLICTCWFYFCAVKSLFYPHSSDKHDE